MARGSFFAGMMKSGALAAALLAGAAVPGYAGDPPKLALTGSAVITTDYMFRSISNTNRESRRAARIRSDLRHVLGLHLGIQYRISGKDIEIDYGAGISPKWGPVTFTFAGL